MGRIENTCMAMATAWLVLLGCSALEPKPDPSRFFTLTPVAQSNQKAIEVSSNPSGISLGIGPVKLPGYLDREQLVTRVSQNRFQVSENDRWAEPLTENFIRVLMENLTALAPAARLVTYPWRAGERPQYQLEIDVLRFESDGTGHVELVARWLIRETATKHASAVTGTRLTPSVKGSSAEHAVTAMSAALGELSQEIAQAVNGKFQSFK